MIFHPSELWLLRCDAQGEISPPAIDCPKTGRPQPARANKLKPTPRQERHKERWRVRRSVITDTQHVLFVPLVIEFTQNKNKNTKILKVFGETCKTYLYHISPYRETTH